MRERTSRYPASPAGRGSKAVPSDLRLSDHGPPPATARHALSRTFNPLVVGSSPTRPTAGALVRAHLTGVPWRLRCRQDRLLARCWAEGRTFTGRLGPSCFAAPDRLGVRWPARPVERWLSTVTPMARSLVSACWS